MQAYQLDRYGETPTTILVMEAERNVPLTVLRPGEQPAQQWHLPETACELVTRVTVYDEIWEALEKIKLSKQARTAVEKMLEDLPV